MPETFEAATRILDTAPSDHATESQLNTGKTFVNPDDPPWGMPGALLVWFLSICLIVLVPQLVVIPYVIGKGFRFGTPEEVQAMLQFLVTDKTSVILQILALLPCHLLTALMVWALVTRFGRRPFWSALGWGWGTRFRLWSCVGLALILVIVSSALVKFVGGDKPTPLQEIINSSLAARYLLSFFAVASAPLVEELVYRGVLYAPLQRVIGVRAAVITVVLLFTIIHVPQYWTNLGVILAVAILSLALTVVRAHTGRLLPCVVIHLVFNGIQASLLLLEPYLQRFVHPPPVTPPALILLRFAGFHI